MLFTFEDEDEEDEDEDDEDDIDTRLLVTLESPLIEVPSVDKEEDATIGSNAFKLETNLSLSRSLSMSASSAPQALKVSTNDKADLSSPAPADAAVVESPIHAAMLS